MFSVFFPLLFDFLCILDYNSVFFFITSAHKINLVDTNFDFNFGYQGSATFEGP